MSAPATPAGKTRRAAIVMLLAVAFVFGVAAGDQPAPSAAESVLGAPPSR